MKIKVKNLNGSGTNYPNPTCKCRTWFEHWEYNKYNMLGKYSKYYCRSCNKLFAREELVGGHVIKSNSTDRTIYIVPICKACNNKPDHEFEVESSDLIPAAKEYCKKDK